MHRFAVHSGAIPMIKGDVMSTQDWLNEHPQVMSVRIAASDLNGQARGKRIPRQFAGKLIDSGARFPFSVLNLDIFGEDIEDSPLVMASGDQDAVVMPTERGFLPMPWLQTPSALLPIWMFQEDGRPFMGDPRHALKAVLDRFSGHGLTPVVAVELEFYLVDDSDGLRPPKSPVSGKRSGHGEILSLRALDHFDGFFNDLYAACEAMHIPADTAISEGGPGQFEINLMHCDNALRAADDAFLFKMLVKGLARKHGFAASFMAKPYEDEAGSGLHMHFSVLDRDGNNIFDDGGDQGTDALRHAIKGCLDALSDSTLIFAPHANSYQRMVPGAHAPNSIVWAYENRTVAIRVPGGAPAARRIEHRVAGGDVNPYLTTAAILGAALHGIETGELPPEPITGNAYDMDLPRMPVDWATAIDQLDQSALMRSILPGDLIDNLVLTKRQELRRVSGLSPAEQAEIYLETV